MGQAFPFLRMLAGETKFAVAPVSLRHQAASTWCTDAIHVLIDARTGSGVEQ